MTNDKPEKSKRGKKRLSDFEIVRTILQRTCERKLPYILKNMGEDEDILFFCSEDESDFVYGSSDISIALFEFTDPSLKEIVEVTLKKMYGLNQDIQHSLLINIRDQISELSKTKGESIACEVKTNDAGSAWSPRTDTRGQERIVWFSKAIDSLFHFQVVSTWCKKYRPLLRTEDPNNLYYPYSHPDGDTYTIVKLDPIGGDNHPITSIYPNGFRMTVTRGVDVIIDKGMTEFPYPIVKEELIVFKESGSACQIAHRLIGDGWRMLLLRPNSVVFPPLSMQTQKPGYLEL